MLNSFKLAIFGLFALSFFNVSQADLFYDPDKTAQMKNLESVDSVRLTSEYLCGKSALYLSANATDSELNGRFATVSGKIVTGEKSMDVSASLNGAIMSYDIIASGLNVRCNKEHGAFLLVFSPGQVFTGKPEDRLTVTSIEIFADGTVIGSRSRRKQKTN